MVDVVRSGGGRCERVSCAEACGAAVVGGGGGDSGGGGGGVRSGPLSGGRDCLTVASSKGVVWRREWCLASTRPVAEVSELLWPWLVDVEEEEWEGKRGGVCAHAWP